MTTRLLTMSLPGLDRMGTGTLPVTGKKERADDEWTGRTMKRRSFLVRKFRQRVFEASCILALVVSIGLMLWILATLFYRGLSGISLELLIEPTKPFGIPHQGMGNAFLGTLLITMMAALLAIPLGLAAGIYLAEYDRHSWLARTTRASANIMMGIPSIVIGLFVYAILVVPMGSCSGLAGSVALALIMFPLVTRTTEDMLLMVPDQIREAGLALGVPHWRVTLSIVCRACRGGLVSGGLLAFARVSGETAPLLFTALWSHSWPVGYFTSPTASVPVLLTEYMTASPFEQQRALGWAAASLLMIMILILNLSTRIIFRRRSAS